MNDKTITIYNYHKADRKESWHRTVISGMEYHYSTEKAVSGQGAIVRSQVLTIIIPKEAETEGKNYIDAVNYGRLSKEDASQYWTINPSCNKDVIVCGAVTEEISDNYTIIDLKKDHQKSGIVSGFYDNADNDLLKHYKAVCK